MPHFTNLADAADYLGNLSDVMRTYDGYDNADQDGFMRSIPA